MIEKNIFQTYKTRYEELGDYAKSTSGSWMKKNPEWQYNYFSDKDIEDFVRDFFGKKWLDNLLHCPIGVMKSDMWRCMILYARGGVYADLDTICTDKVESWIDEDYSAVFNWGPEGHIQNWTFAAKSGSPVLENILANMDRQLHSINQIDINYVYNTTGPVIFTKSIIEYIESGHDDIMIIEDIDLLTIGKVVHLNAARYWKFDSYDSWNKELEIKINETV
jgi:mannosyltransferase OCH1-like enzyme